MSKESFLTVLIPIKDSDCEATVYADEASLIASVPPSLSNINKIYKVADGTYYRVWGNPSSGAVEYHPVVDREFPLIGKPLEIYDFTYDATRMGAAPTISANVKWYADKDSSGNDITLEELWTQRCHVVFNGEKLYLKRVPSSSKNNEDARYGYDITFVAEREVLERVYFYDVVSPFISEKPISESVTFSFYGDVEELLRRINASLIRSGLASLTRKYVPYPDTPEYTVPYLTYEQWTMLNVNPSSLIGTVFSSQDEMMEFYSDVYSALGADYNSYLMQYVFVNDDGVYTVNGYQCKIGIDKYGETTESDEKMLSFDKNTIHEALQQIHDTFELQYYITKEKDGSGAFTGNTFIVVGDSEHDFADWDALSGDYVRDEEGIPTTDNPFDYGVANELISKEKNNTTDKIVSRITGVGSSENIPWHYPNPTPDGWLKPVFIRDGVELNTVAIDYPTSEGTTASDYVRYERFLKNRIGNAIKWGTLTRLITDSEASYGNPELIIGDIVPQYFSFETGDCAAPKMTLYLDYHPNESRCTRFVVKLYDKTIGVTKTFDSYEIYQNPDAFQSMCLNHNGDGYYDLVPFHSYSLEFKYYLSSWPVSDDFDEEGYYYPYETFENPYAPNHFANVEQNFYDQSGLTAFIIFDSIHADYNAVIDSGYSTDGQRSGKVAPLTRVKGLQYKDIVSGIIYKCNSADAITFPDSLPAFIANPETSIEEWKRRFLDTRIRIYESNGWYIGSKQVSLLDYGLGAPTIGGNQFTPQLLDAIDFKRVKWLTSQTNLMPEVFIKTDGERRFYNAHNYWDSVNETLLVGTADTAIGEVQVDDKVRNPIYKEEETDADSEHYEFENEYIKDMPHEHIENFEDVKPTIKGQTNTVDGNIIRIDVVETFEYDTNDNDEIWETSDGGSVEGEYKHPYFFAKLRPMGFNLFDLALQEDMVISMTTGACGACNFKIGVDENTKKNPVQVWKYDVYKGDTLSSATKVYDAGDLRRYVNTDGLYYNTNDTQSGYISVNSGMNTLGGGTAIDGYSSYVNVYERYIYSTEEVMEGFVGTMKKDGKIHFEGDVVTSGRFIESQQDTTENYVWVALMKDTETYGKDAESNDMIMPSARPNYNNPTYNQYIRPKSITDVHITADPSQGISESTNEEDEEKADKFVIVNIRMPQIYLRRAEHELSRELVKYMYENNAQKFNFSIKFSRIFLAENDETDDNLNENSVLYVPFNNKIYRQYVKHYTYKMSHDTPLPEIDVDMNEELSVSRTMLQQWDAKRRKDGRSASSSFGKMVRQMRENIERTTVSRNDDSILSANVIVRDTRTSLIELGKGGVGIKAEAISLEEIDEITEI